MEGCGRDAGLAFLGNDILTFVTAIGDYTNSVEAQGKRLEVVKTSPFIPCPGIMSNSNTRY